MHTLPNRGIIYLAARFVIASLSRTSPRGGGVFRCCRVDRKRSLNPRLFATQSLRRTKASLIDRRSGNLRAIPLRG
jgi:hypothetical protein